MPSQPFPVFDLRETQTGMATNPLRLLPRPYRPLHAFPFVPTSLYRAYPSAYDRQSQRKPAAF